MRLRWSQRWLTAAALGLAFIAIHPAESGAAEPGSTMAIEIEAVRLLVDQESALEPDPGDGQGALPRLIVDLRNASTQTIVGWTVEVELDGEVVDGYQEGLFLEPVAPGEAISLELFRLEPPSRSSTLAVTVVEAWSAEKRSADEWRLLAPLEGAPVRFERRIEVAEQVSD